VNTGTFATANEPTFQEIVSMEKVLQSASADASRASYVMNPSIASTLKTTPLNNSDVMVWTAGDQPGEGKVNGLRAYSTTNCPDGTVILGNWSDFIMGFWGAIDVETNPYEDFAKGIVGVRAFASLDFAVRHGESFAVYSSSQG
jgi:HK97 family phage major capsid protein